MTDLSTFNLVSEVTIQRGKSMRAPTRFQQCSICLSAAPMTWEHVIAQSIGGTLEADIQCRKCNSELGTQLVSKVKKDPSIRLAIRQLKEELPDLFESMESGLPYVITDTNGESVPATRRQTEYRIRAHQREDGSIITETREAPRNLRKILQKDGLDPGEIDSALALFAEAPSNTPIPLSEQTTIIKWSGESNVEPNLKDPLMDDRVVAVIAYNYLCLLLGTLVLGDELNFVRRYIADGIPSDKLKVEHFTSRRYAPFHRLRVDVSDSETCIEVRLFGWLVYEVRFRGIVYRGPDCVYIEDLPRRRGLIANSAKDATEGEFYSTK